MKTPRITLLILAIVAVYGIQAITQPAANEIKVKFHDLPQESHFCDEIVLEEQATNPVKDAEEMVEPPYDPTLDEPFYVPASELPIGHLLHFATDQL